MELLGSNLEQLFSSCNYAFSVKTTLMLVYQMLYRIEFIHSRYYIHRDIKPDNFVMGQGKNANKVYCIDFGLAKRFRDIKTGEHIAYKEGRPLIGTVRYSSIGTHLGVEQTRRDDLESLAYIIIYFLKGSLPWQNVKGKNKKEVHMKMLERKLEITEEELCKGLPGF